MKFTKKHKAQKNSQRKQATWEKFKNQQNKLNASRRGVKQR
ncbi:hypothetical protein [Nicoliella lavandulae]|uniref:Uncharacterized protein n=1 Tax=Nicoliella lavandulae TaxID=3082954 RepID=A0ABU8SK79_9LACO